MSKKSRHKVSKAGAAKPVTVAVKKTVVKNSPPLKISFLHFIPLSIALLAFLILWSRPYSVKLTDPWFDGAVLIDSANKTTDTLQRNLLLDEAGKKLKGQAQIHPYHARVHYLYGFYWFARNNWDSAISEEKEAIRIGTGGVVNQVEYKAQDILNSAISNKVMPVINAGNFKEAFDILENAKTSNLFNPGIESYRGIVFSRQGNPDSALSCFLRFKETNPKDVNNLTNIAISYNQKNMRDSARAYIDRALKLDPNNENAKRTDSQLNSH